MSHNLVNILAVDNGISNGTLEWNNLKGVGRGLWSSGVLSTPGRHAAVIMLLVFFACKGVVNAIRRCILIGIVAGSRCLLTVHSRLWDTVSRIVLLIWNYAVVRVVHAFAAVI